MIRVAQVVRPAAGGIRRHVTALLEHLNPERFSCSLYAPSDFQPDRELTGVPHFPLEIAAKTHPFRDWRTARQLSRALRQHPADIVHAQGLRAAWICALVEFGPHVPLVCTAHNLIASGGLLPRLVVRFVGRRTSRMVAVSQAVAETLIRAGMPEPKITVIPNGIEPLRSVSDTETAALRARYGIASDSPLAVAVGRLSPEKGFDVLLEAFRKVQERLPEAHLILAGDGPQSAALKQQAEQLFPGTTDSLPSKRVAFVGHLADPVPLLHAANLVVIPSRQEGQGIVALEAMAAGKPVIASRIGGLVETIVPDVTGLLVTPENPYALGEAILALLSNPALCEPLGNAGRQRVEREFSLARMLQSLETLYTDLKTRA